MTTPADARFRNNNGLTAASGLRDDGDKPHGATSAYSVGRAAVAAGGKPQPSSADVPISALKSIRTPYGDARPETLGMIKLRTSHGVDNFLKTAPALLHTQKSPGSALTPAPTALPELRAAARDSVDIRTRLRQLSTPYTSRAKVANVNAASEFKIAAVREPRCTPSAAPRSIGALNASSRVNQLQAELQLREMEVQKLAEAAAYARRERDDLQEQVRRLNQQSTSTALAKAPNSSELQRCADDLARALRGKDDEIKALKGALGTKDASLGFNATAAASADKSEALSGPTRDSLSQSPCQQDQTHHQSNGIHGPYTEEAAELQRQVVSAGAEVHQHRTRADAAEAKARMMEARADALQAAEQEAMAELKRMKGELHPLHAELRRTIAELAAMRQRAEHAEAALAEARLQQHKPRRGIAGGAEDEEARAAALAEEALTAQVRALAVQLQAARTEAAAAKSAMQGRVASEETVTASFLSANKELEAALSQASHELDARANELSAARAALTTLSEENRSLQASAARAAQLESQSNALHQELRTVTARLAQLEDAAARYEHVGRAGGEHGVGRGAFFEDTSDADRVATERRPTGGGGAGAVAPSPLRDVVNTLRAELQDRELRLAAAEEELSASRQRQSELQRQTLDQAVELDELQRTAEDVASLQRELEQSKQGMRSAQREADRLRAELARTTRDQIGFNGKNGAPDGVAPPRNELAAVLEERDRLRNQVQAHSAEIMALQGQVSLLRNAMQGAGVSAGGSSANAELENWLME